MPQPMFSPLLRRHVQRSAARTVQLSAIADHEVQNSVLTGGGIGTVYWINETNPPSWAN